MAGIEEDVIKYYARFWSKFEQWWSAEDTLGIHLGYYDEHARTHVQSVLNMNDYTWKLLTLDGSKPAQVLDVGCGVGGTSIYLAKKFPNVSFTGINISPIQIQMARQFATSHHVTANTNFIEKSYIDPGLQDNSYDGVFALESTNYSSDREAYIKEMYRVLKPGGRFAVLDGLLNGKQINPVLKRLHKIWLDGRGLTSLESLDDLTGTMKQQGFRDIQIIDISKYVARSAMRSSIIGLPFFVSAVVKIILTLNHYNKAESYDYFIGVTFLGSLLAVGGYTSYYAVIGTK